MQLLTLMTQVWVGNDPILDHRSVLWKVQKSILSMIFICIGENGLMDVQMGVLSDDICRLSFKTYMLLEGRVHFDHTESL